MTYHMPLDEEGIRARVRDSLVDFSFSCLAIRTKTGAVEPFSFNHVQLFLHREIQTQLRETGKVRALVLKGRQLGCSTYVAARFYHRTEDEDYRRAYRLSLEQMAWRRWKQEELKSDLLFRQEFPATAAEAFQLSGHDSFIPPALVLRARKTVFQTPVTGPLVIGFDPAWMGAIVTRWRSGAAARYSRCAREPTCRSPKAPDGWRS